MVVEEHYVFRVGPGCNPVFHSCLYGYVMGIAIKWGRGGGGGGRGRISQAVYYDNY